MEPCVQSLRSEIQEAGMNKFVYDKDLDYDVNLHRWYQANCEEREYHGDTPYGWEEAKKVFNKIARQNGWSS